MATVSAVALTPTTRPHLSRAELRVLDAISLEKDVDGFAPANLGALAMRGREPLYVSCTPQVRRLNRAQERDIGAKGLIPQ